MEVKKGGESDDGSEGDSGGDLPGRDLAVKNQEKFS